AWRLLRRPGARAGRRTIKVAGDETAVHANERRLLAAAALHHHRASRVEAAARRRRQRAWHLSSERHVFAALVRVRRQRRREERPGIRMLGVRGHVARGTELDEL